MAAAISTISDLFNHANIQEYYTLEDVNADKNANNLTNNNTVAFNPGRFTNAADAGASNTNKSLTIASKLGYGGGAYSILFWFKQHAEVTTDNHTLIDVEDDTSDSLLFVRYSYNGGNPVLFFTRDKSGVAAEGPSYSTALGTDWHGIALTYDGTSIRGYLDGVLVAGPTAASGNGTNAVAAAFGIFKRVRDDNEYTSGLIDDVGLFNAEISAALIAQAHSGGGSFMTTNRGYW